MHSAPIILKHNLRPDEFMWLWGKYATGFNQTYHCTNSLRGTYSRILSKPRNPGLADQAELVLDERPWNSFRAFYICGVSKHGYSGKRNYPLNLHTAILPAPGVADAFEFRQWRLSVENGLFLRIPTEAELPVAYRRFPLAFVTCRIFRWACVFFSAGGPEGLRTSSTVESNAP
jgi:hypothetical protein